MRYQICDHTLNKIDSKTLASMMARIKKHLNAFENARRADEKRENPQPYVLGIEQRAKLDRILQSYMTG